MKKCYFIILFVFASFSVFAQWTQQVSGVTNTLRGVYFINDQVGWVCGESLYGFSPILKTTDGGNTWSIYNYPTADALRGIAFVNADTGETVGFTGTILRTTDGGTNWSVIPSGTTQPLRSICFTSPDTGYICGGLGTVLKSVDGGLTWTAQNSGITTDLINIRFASNDVGYAVASTSLFDNGAVIKTTDGGATWTTVYADPLIGYLGVAVVDANTVYAGGTNETIIKSSDGGTTWTTVYTGLTAYYLRCGDFIGNNQVWIGGGTAGDIFYTADGGATWTSQDSLPGYEVLGIQFPSANTGWAVATLGTILKYTPCLPLGTLSAIDGPTTLCSGDTAFYSVSEVSGANAYHWTSAPGTIITGNGTTDIQVVAGTSSGTITVTATNGCDSISTSISVTVNPLPPAPAITFDGFQLTSTSASTYQWSLNGSIIPGATNQSYTPSQNGLYTVSITDANGCNAVSAEFNLVAVGTAMVAASTFSIVPNPLTTNSIISVPATSGAHWILISDAAGKMIRKILVDNQTVTLSKGDFAAGLYLVTLQSDLGTVISRAKLLVQ